MPTALELHGIRVRMRGFPIYDDEELIGIMDEPDWVWSELTSEQQAEVHQLAVRLQNDGERTWDVVFPFVLGEYGIACPHKWNNHEPTWRECRWCGAGEPLRGRVVRVGQEWFRVPDPPPPVFRVPVAAGVDGLIIHEYRWTGTHYEFAPSPGELAPASHHPLRR